MYPHTTSLYVATVVDNATYCRGNDDIIVVEFDEDERGARAQVLKHAVYAHLFLGTHVTHHPVSIDETGALPKCHIPARFTVMIPREYQETKKTASTNSSGNEATAVSKRTSKTASSAANAEDSMLDGLLGPMDEEDFDPFVNFSAGGN